MNIELNFFYGSVGKYRRHSETFTVDPDTREKTKFTMFQNNNTMLDLAQSLVTGNFQTINVKSISYKEWKGESSSYEGGNTVFWNNPPLDFPEQYLRGKKIEFTCIGCNGKDSHEESCTFQDNTSLTCNEVWVYNNKVELGLQDFMNEDKVIEYKRLPGNSINQSKTSPKVFKRIELTIEENENNYYVHVYDLERIRIVHLPFTSEWSQKSVEIINYLNRYGRDILEYPIEFNDKYSFVSQITENERLIDKNDRTLGLKIDLEKMKKDDFMMKNYQTKYGPQVNYKVLTTNTFYSFEQIFYECKLGGEIELDLEEYQGTFEDVSELVKKKLLQFWTEKRTKIQRTIEDYKNIFKHPFVHVQETVHSTGAIQRFYKTQKYEDLYLNILFLDSIANYNPDPEGVLTEEENNELNEMKRIIATNFINCYQLDKIYEQKLENFKTDFDNLKEIVQYDNNERNLTSAKKYTKNGKEPPISVRNTQPFARGLEPYSFKGRVLYKDSIIDYKGIKRGDYYYPVCVGKTKKNFKEYISALIQGFPKDEEEANKYGIDWNNGWEGPIFPKDNQSGIKEKYEPNGRVIEPLGNINQIKFKECVKKKSLKYEDSFEATEKKFTFLKPLTIENLFTISGKKIRAQSIPEESLIAYCNEGTVYYRFEGEILQIPIECNKNGHGYIHNKTFVPMNYDDCACKKDILQYCEKELNKSLKNKKIYKLLFFTREGEGFYWSSKGYPELKCSVDINQVRNLYNVYLKDENNEIFQVKPNEEKGKKHSTLKEFPRYFFYQMDRISKPKTTLPRFFKGKNILVNGLYNDFGQIYQGKPLNKTNIVNKKLYENTIKNNLNNNLDLEAILRCFKRKNIENFIKITSPVDLNFFKMNISFVDKKLKKINIPFSTQEILGKKISDFTKQFIDKEITDFKQSAVLFYDEGDTIKFFYAE